MGQKKNCANLKRQQYLDKKKNECIKIYVNCFVVIELTCQMQGTRAARQAERRQMKRKREGNSETLTQISVQIKCFFYISMIWWVCLFVFVSLSLSLRMIQSMIQRFAFHFNRKYLANDEIDEFKVFKWNPMPYSIAQQNKQTSNSRERERAKEKKNVFTCTHRRKPSIDWIHILLWN